ESLGRPTGLPCASRVTRRTNRPVHPAIGSLGGPTGPNEIGASAPQVETWGYAPAPSSGGRSNVPAASFVSLMSFWSLPAAPASTAAAPHTPPPPPPAAPPPWPAPGRCHGRRRPGRATLSAGTASRGGPRRGLPPRRR